MDHAKGVESVLNALLLNPTEEHLLDTLLTLWNKLTDEEKNDLVSDPKQLKFIL